ncbi:MAG: HPt (histidine-containing phosphotransfer) domain-containing protein [Salibacteraceae bacterium]|jgi:HPt (histidine-containing phosphotransfer) domain-containing protein
MTENIKMLVLEMNQSTFNQIKKEGELVNINSVHVMDGLSAIGLFRLGNCKLVLINVDPFFKPQGFRKTMTFLRFANRSNDIEIGIFGDDISSRIQLMLLDFGVKTFLSSNFTQIELTTFADKVSGKENFISILKQKEANYSGTFPLDVEHVIQQSNSDSAFVQLVFKTFEKEIPEYFKELEKSISSRDKIKISQIAHKVKSPLSIVGVKDFISLTETLENEMEKILPDWNVVHEAATKLTDKFKCARIEIQKIL